MTHDATRTAASYVEVRGARALYIKPFNSAQAAEYLGISTRQLLRLVYAGIVPATKLGNQWRFSQEKLAEIAGTID